MRFLDQDMYIKGCMVRRTAQIPTRCPEPEPEGETPLTGRGILSASAKHSGFTVAEIIGPRRHKPLVKVRQTAIWRVKRHCPHLSLPAIGRIFGDRDHTTILHSVKRVEQRMARGEM